MKVAVIGSGPNGLTAAAVLKKAHHDVVVLESASVVGGLAAAGEIGGQPHTGILHDTHLVQPEIVSKLGLEVQWRLPPPICDVAGEPLRRPASYTAFIDAIRPLVKQVVTSPPPDPGTEARLLPWAKQALAAYRVGTAQMMEALRIGPTAVQDMLAEHFDDPAQAALLMPDALFGAWMGPRSPTSTAHLLLHEGMAGREIVGGPGALVAALQRVAPKVRTDACVTQILVADGRVTGVQLRSGEVVSVSAVVSTLSPVRTLRDLVAPMQLPAILDRDLGKIRHRGILAKMHLLTDSPLFGTERVRLASHPDHLERAFDDAKHRRLPRAPGLDIRQVGRVASIFVFGAAIDLDGGWTDEARAGLQEAVLGVLEGAVPDVRERIQALELLTPADLQQRFGLEGGHLMQGEVALDQLWFMRPLPRLARAETGIEGLVLGGEGMHPGMPLTLVPGWLAARRLA